MGKSTIYCLAIQFGIIVGLFVGCTESNHQAQDEKNSPELESVQFFPKYDLLPMTLDHINIAISNLEYAKQHYSEKLGFTLKPGRLHENSILNAFAKFSDGTLIELITASEPKDELAQWYVQFTQKNSNAPSFAAFKIDTLTVMDSLKSRLDHDSISYSYQQGGYAHLLSINHYERYHTPFFIHYTQPVVDQPKFLSHLNGANRMIAIWLPYRILDMELMDGLGWYSTDSIQIPNIAYPAANIALEEGAIYVLPDSIEQRVIGVSLEVDDISTTQQLLSKNLARDIAIQSWEFGRSIFITPEEGLGIWIEFREK